MVSRTSRREVDRNNLNDGNDKEKIEDGREKLLICPYGWTSDVIICPLISSVRRYKENKNQLLRAVSRRIRASTVKRSLDKNKACFSY
jgi:hypothetical protein